MTQAREAPEWRRIRGAYHARVVAQEPDGSQVLLSLGEHRADSPRLALRWLRGRVQDVADQLDPPYARPVWAWLVDVNEHAWALDFLAAGDPYVFRATDEDGTRYVFTAEPVALSHPIPSRGPVRAGGRPHKPPAGARLAPRTEPRPGAELSLPLARRDGFPWSRLTDGTERQSLVSETELAESAADAEGAR